MKTNIVLDKSFIRAVSLVKIRELENDYHFLLPTQFLYEVFKDNQKRKEIFNKFSSSESYKIIEPFSVLAKTEAKSKNPCKPSQCILQRDYSIHKKLIRDDFKLSNRQKRVLEEELNHYNEITASFLTNILKPNIDANNTNKKPKITKAEILNYTKILIEKNEIKHHPAENCNFINENWLLFIHHQVLENYRHDLVSNSHSMDRFSTEKSYNKLQHDLIDALYLMQGILENGFATAENKLLKFWHELSKPGSVILFFNQNKKEIEIFRKE